MTTPEPATNLHRASGIWSLVHAERAALAADLADLTDQQWATLSLCTGKTVRQLSSKTGSPTSCTATSRSGAPSRSPSSAAAPTGARPTPAPGASPSSTSPRPAGTARQHGSTAATSATNPRRPELTELLSIFDAARADATFVMTFVAPLNPTDDPLYDLDMATTASSRASAAGWARSAPHKVCQVNGVT